MAQLIKHGSELLDRLASLSFERGARTLRGLAAMVYLLFAGLIGMQLASPGALARITSQQVGRALLGMLAVALLLPALTGIADRATGRERGPLEPGASDAILHGSVALAGLGLWLGSAVMTASQRDLAFAILGSVLVATGVVLLVSGTLHGLKARREAHEHSVQALQRRDGLTRGAISAVLGAFLWNAALVGVSDLGSSFATRPLTTPLLAVTGLALVAYGWHALWLAREADQLWSR